MTAVMAHWLYYNLSCVFDSHWRKKKHFLSLVRRQGCVLKIFQKVRNWVSPQQVPSSYCVIYRIQGEGLRNIIIINTFKCVTQRSQKYLSCTFLIWSLNMLNVRKGILSQILQRFSSKFSYAFFISSLQNAILNCLSNNRSEKGLFCNFL